jgi:hypothetical protein
VAGRRFGKSFLGVPELARMAWGPERLAWYVSPTWRQAKDDLWRPLKRILRPWIVGKPNESDLSVELVSGGRIALRSADNYDSLRGAGLDGLVVDEYADVAPEAWTEALRPMLSDKLGRALFIGTPEGFNHFYDLFNEARAGRADWQAWQFTTAQGGNVPLAEIESARHDLDEKTFRQEYEASFENIGSGKAYYAFERAGNLRPQQFNPDEPLCWSCDFNIDPMCSVIAQKTANGINVLDELILPDSSTHDACREFGERLERYSQILQSKLQWGVAPITVRVYGDATGQNRQHAGPSDWQIIREYFSRVSDRVNVSWHIGSSNPAIKDRVAAVNSLLRSHAGDRRLLVDPRCKSLTADFEQVMWKTDPHGNPLSKLDDSNKKLTHVSDATGYLVWKEFPLKQVGGYGTQYLGV